MLTGQRPAAIVTEIAGTTRDVIHSTLNINGYPVLVSDTAGIRNDGSEDVIEMEGIRRSIGEAKQANLVLLVLDARHLFGNATSDVDFKANVVSYCQTYQKSLTIDSILSATDHIVIANKWDLLTSEQRKQLQLYSDDVSNFIPISCKTEFGISRMLSHMTHRFKHM